MKKEAHIIIYNQILFECRKLENEILSINEQLKELPEGRIYCTRNGTHFKCYLTDGHVQTYIPKKESEYAKQLARRRYLVTLQQDYQNELAALQSYLRDHKEGKASDMLKESSVYHMLLSPFPQSPSPDFSDWADSPYEKNTNYPEGLKFETNFGLYVRSKSESMIAMMLHTYHIPFRYECALELGGITIYPDFTIRHPGTGKIHYWEHLGMVDTKDYARRTSSKLSLYIENGFTISNDLIITSETKTEPLMPMSIEKTIQHHFL